MKHLILIRHGQSEWNQQKRFTGWVDVGLTDKGKAEAKKAGKLIEEKKIKLDSFYSSFQKRANDTLKIVMKELNKDENTIMKWSKVPELKNALEKYLGKNSINKLDKLLRNNILDMNNNTKKLYENFKNLMTTLKFHV